RVQAQKRRGVREHPRAERLAVDEAGGVEDARPERRHHRRVRSAVRFHELVRDEVQIERQAASRDQLAQDEALSGGDPAGETDAQPGPAAQLPANRVADMTVFFIKSAIVNGPTPPGTGVSADAVSRTEGSWTSPTSAEPLALNRS